MSPEVLGNLWGGLALAAGGATVALALLVGVCLWAINIAYPSR
jgi:hypothetical protein